jgi:hypothetical protein
LDQWIGQFDHQGINDMKKMIVGIPLLLLMQGCSVQKVCPCPNVFPQSDFIKKHLEETSHHNLGYCHRHDKSSGKRHCHRH